MLANAAPIAGVPATKNVGFTTLQSVSTSGTAAQVVEIGFGKVQIKYGSQRKSSEMLPKEQRAALLSSKEYMSLWRRGVLDRVVQAQRGLTNFMAYGYDKGYLVSSMLEIQLALDTMRDYKDENPEV